MSRTALVIPIPIERRFITPETAKAKRLRALMDRHKLNSRQVAAVIRAHPGSIRRWKRTGKIMIEQLEYLEYWFS